MQSVGVYPNTVWLATGIKVKKTSYKYPLSIARDSQGTAGVSAAETDASDATGTDVSISGPESKGGLAFSHRDHPKIHLADNCVQ